MDNFDPRQEIRLLRRARECADLLSQGRDPMSPGGERPVPEDSVLRHEKLRGCFGYVSRMIQLEMDSLEHPARTAEMPKDFTAKNLEYTVKYIDRLAEGRDPLSKEGGTLPGDAALQQEKMRRCFQYIAKVLRRQAGRLRSIPVNDVMTGIARAMGFSGSPTFLSRAAHEWLVQKEYIVQTVRADEVSDYAPTPDGAALGMSAAHVKRGGRDTVYQEILCGPQAQQFLRDSGEQILDYERRQWDPLLECLTPEWQSQAGCLPEPYPLKNLVMHINSQFPCSLPRRLIPSQVFVWMHKNGVIERTVKKDRLIWSPTEKGKELGVSLLPSGTTQWSVPAQQFVLDHLKQMVQDMASGEAFRIERAKRVIVPEEFAGKLPYGTDMEWLPGLEKAVNDTLQLLGCQDGRLPPKLLMTWLSSEGYLKEVQLEQEGKRVSRQAPTEKGRAAGITLNEAGWAVFSEPAQRMVADNMQNICDYYYSRIQ